FEGHQFTSPINRLIAGVSANMTTPPAMPTAATAPKSSGSGIEPYSADRRPPMKLPTEIPRYHRPIISPVTRAGASLVTALMPTGLSDSSPHVCSREVTPSQDGHTLRP